MKVVKGVWLFGWLLQCELIQRWQILWFQPNQTSHIWTFRSCRCNHLYRSSFCNFCLRKLSHSCQLIVFYRWRLKVYLNIINITLILINFDFDIGIAPSKGANLFGRKIGFILRHFDKCIFNMRVVWSFNHNLLTFWFFREKFEHRRFHRRESFNIIECMLWEIQFKI